MTASLVARYGYEVRGQSGNDDGTDWEVSFALPYVEGRRDPVVHHCAAPDEESLMRWLERWLPEQAARDWMSRAIDLQVALMK